MLLTQTCLQVCMYEWSHCQGEDELLHGSAHDSRRTSGCSEVEMVMVVSQGKDSPITSTCKWLYIELKKKMSFFSPFQLHACVIIILCYLCISIWNILCHGWVVSFRMGPYTHKCPLVHAGNGYWTLIAHSCREICTIQCSRIFCLDSFPSSDVRQHQRLQRELKEVLIVEIFPQQTNVSNNTHLKILYPSFWDM